MAKNKKVLYSKNTDNWTTPKNIYNHFVKEKGCIDLFPYCSTFNQYEKNYYNQKLFCNPPYSDMNNVVKYLVKQIEKGCTIYLLVPSRTDTKWFHYLSVYITHISFFKGRLKFGNSNNTAPFPSMLLKLEMVHILPPLVIFNPYSYFEIKKDK